jgi:predicted nucleic acid-binding protein
MIRATHSRYVLDASVAAKWFTRHEEPDRGKAIALRTRHLGGLCALTVPEFALLEIVNAVRFSGRADESDANRAVTALEKLRLDIVPLDWDLLRQAARIAWTHQVALYDSVYVALAERLGFPLLTADETMARRLSGHGSVVRLADLELPG